MAQRIFFYMLFFSCASLSTYIFHLDDDYIFYTSIFPGLLFILTTIICSLFITRLALRPTLEFSGLAFLLYLGVFYLTLVSSYFAFVVGMLTGGFGAMLYFALYNDFIKTINYRKKGVFILGSLAFILNDFLLFTPIRNIDAGFFSKDITGNFSATFFIWQIVIGTALVNKLIAQKDKVNSVQIPSI
jgi:hypothetical protein